MSVNEAGNWPLIRAGAVPWPPGRVYFIGDGSAIKIGWSGAHKERLQALQTSSPATLKIIGTVIADQAFERTVHDRFADLRIRGEWFKDTPELRAFIAEACRITRLVDQVGRLCDDLVAWGEPRAELRFTCLNLSNALKGWVEQPYDHERQNLVARCLENLKTGRDWWDRLSPEMQAHHRKMTGKPRVYDRAGTGT